MAPEELTRGATVDERTTVVHLGRTISELLGPTGLSTTELAAADEATRVHPGHRFPDVEPMVAAWHRSRR